MPGVEHCRGDTESALLGGEVCADETALVLELFVRLAGARSLVLKFVQLRIITGELSCKSGSDDEIFEEPLIDLVNLEAHIATGD